jgi:endonuclease/exonuclease/phosphatase family metal-dependent hydrolase
LQAIKLIALDEGGLWYVQSPKQDGQHRVGGRMAIAALLETEKGPLGCVAVHYESESNPDHRNQQTQRLMELLVQEYGTIPMVIGGDLNTNTLSEAHTNQTQRRIQPESWEPSFSTFANYNFAWETANTGQTTTRRGPHHSTHTPHRTLDWLLLRSCQGSQSRVVPALSKAGDYLSDHEMVVSTVSC